MNKLIIKELEETLNHWKEHYKELLQISEKKDKGINVLEVLLKVTRNDLQNEYKITKERGNEIINLVTEKDALCISRNNLVKDRYTYKKKIHKLEKSCKLHNEIENNLRKEIQTLKKKT